eukprot:gene1523-1684_t
MLDELIELFESAAEEQIVAAKEKANKVAGDIEMGQEMRRLSMESRGESVKRKSGNEAGAGGKEKQKNYGVETFKYLNEKLNTLSRAKWGRKNAFRAGSPSELIDADVINGTPPVVVVIVALLIDTDWRQASVVIYWQT